MTFNEFGKETKPICHKSYTLAMSGQSSNISAAKRKIECVTTSSVHKI